MPSKPIKRKEQIGKRYNRRYALIHRLKDVPCADCGNRFPVYVMEFDHARGEKVCNVPKLWHCSEDVFLAEVEKCDVTCSNCHKIRTHTRKHGEIR